MQPGLGHYRDREVKDEVIIGHSREKEHGVVVCRGALDSLLWRLILGAATLTAP